MGAYRVNGTCLAVPLAVLFLGLASSGFAQDNASYEQRIDALERRVDLLEEMIGQLTSGASGAGQVPLNSTGNPWRSLARDMTEEQVISLLGQPTRISRGIGLDYFHYGDGLGQFVVFKDSKVTGWEE